jgi:hypothetical protein
LARSAALRPDTCSAPRPEGHRPSPASALRPASGPPLHRTPKGPASPASQKAWQLPPSFRQNTHPKANTPVLPDCFHRSTVPRCQRFEGHPEGPPVHADRRPPRPAPLPAARPRTEVRFLTSFQAAWRSPAAFPPATSPEGELTRPSSDRPPRHGSQPRFQDTRRSPFRTTVLPLRPSPLPAASRTRRLVPPRSRAPGNLRRHPLQQPPEGSHLHRHRRPLLRRPPTVARDRPEGLSRAPAASASSSRLLGRTSSDFNEQLRQRRSHRLCSKQARLQGFAPSESPLPPRGGLDRVAPDALLGFQPFRDFSRRLEPMLPQALLS